MLKYYNPIAICLQHVNNPVSSIGKYHLASSSNQQEGNLNTSIYVHSKTIYDKIIVNNNEFQISAIRIQLGNEKITLCNLYNQPNRNYNLGNLQTIIKDFQDPLLMVGDFNAHNPIWDGNCVTSDTSGNAVEHLMDSNSLCCLNNNDSSTFFSKAHGTMSSVDIALCSPNIVDRFEWNVSDDLFTSDHFPILISYLQNTPNTHVPHYNIYKADWEKYEYYTRNIIAFNHSQDHNETNDYIVDFIKNAADKAIPMSTSLPTKCKVPWWSDTLSELIKEKHSIGRRIDRLNKRFNNLDRNNIQGNLIKMVTILIEIDTLKPIYNKLCAKFRRGVIQGKIISWRQYVSGISSQTPIKKIWEKFRKINNSYGNSQRHAIIQNGQKIFDPLEISNILGKLYADISSVDSLDEHFRKIKRKTESKVLNFETVQDLYYNRIFSMDEFDYALTSCNNSAPGKDNVCFEMIKKLAPLAKSYLLQFYNHLWLRNLFPEKWRTDIIVPILKPGKDPSKAISYRPVSLTSCLCKLLEKMVNFRLSWYMKENKMLSPTQFGSQHNRSTIDSLCQLEDHVRRGFERKQITVAVFFDIQKAYNTTWRYFILKSLHDNNMRGHLPLFIKNFLSERTFQVRLDDIYSNIYKLDNGVPQGSVLSGNLFILAINDITKQLPKGIENSLYIDDFAIYYTASNLHHAERMLNIAIKKIDSWAASVGFQFSIEKTQAIMFYRNIRWKKGEEIELRIRDYDIPISQTIKFLGLVFDTHLNWKAHAAYTKAKCKNALNLLRKLSHTTWGADRKTLMILYKATVLSILDYGSEIYGSASEATLKILDPIHNEGMRICTGAFRSSPCSSLQVESGEPPLSLHRDLITLRSAVRIKASDSPTKNLFNRRDIFISNHTPPFPIRANRIFETSNINIKYPPILKFPPPWTINKIKVCTHLSHLSKRYSRTPAHHKQHTIEHIKQKGDHYSIYTDGSKSSYGVGFAIISNDKAIQFSLPKYASVFTAELSALWYAAEEIKTLPKQKFVIFSDSRSALEALKSYNPKNSLVREIKYKFHRLYNSGFDVEICWVPSHIGIRGNEVADKAAKEAITKPRSIIDIPINDYIPALKEFIFNKWQVSWDDESIDNKLKQIKPNVRFWKSSLQKDRHTEVVLCRLRIGHTRLTHGYLMNTPHIPIPECMTCKSPLSIRHLFEVCRVFHRLRVQIFGNKCFKEIISESNTFSVASIMKFLKICNLLDKI